MELLRVVLHAEPPHQEVALSALAQFITTAPLKA
jgi:hypothetical protein